LTSASLPTVDQTIIDGSTNAVSGNAVFDGLATKFPTPTGLTTNYLPKWNGSGFGNSIVQEVGGELQVNGSIKSNKINIDGNQGLFIYDGISAFNAGYYTNIVSRFSSNTGDLSFKGTAGAGKVIGGLADGTQTALYADAALVATLTPTSANFIGTISASPAVSPNQVPTWGQVQAAARPYKVYTALLSQTGTNAPTATVLENTLGGTIVWSRTGNGVYNGTLTGAFASNKTTIQITGTVFNAFFAGFRNDANTVTIGSSDIIGSGADDLILNSTIEIRVYL
jgi:hypothetical protein